MIARIPDLRKGDMVEVKTAGAAALVLPLVLGRLGVDVLTMNGRLDETSTTETLAEHMRDLERRLDHAQAEYAKLVSAWREERLMGSEVEGRLRGEVYTRLFAVTREVAQKEAESREWEREMGRKRQVQAGVEELEVEP